jgi:electron transfer flavoprotein alpha subunit
MITLIVAEHDANGLKPATLSVVSAAQKIGGDIDLMVIGDGAAKAAKMASAIAGVAKVIHVTGAQFDKPTAENVAAQVLATISATRYTHVLAAATGFGKNAMPRVAAKLDVAQVSEITAVESADTFVRPIYAGNAFATVKSNDQIKVITVRATAFDAAAAEGGNARIDTMAGVADTGKSRVTGQELTVSERPELTGARVVISGGRGLGSGENFKMLEPLADKLNAALGASRAAVDAGYVPNDYQVGQTGKIVAPDLYIAVGISGAIQHLAGMKDSKVIVAINKDPDAPIFQIADYGLVGDLFEIIPQLTAALK